MRSMTLLPAFSYRLLLGLFATCLVVGCTPYQPKSYRGVMARTQTADAVVVNAPVMDTTLVIANTKLAQAAGTLTAKINYGKNVISQDFTPSGQQTILNSLKLPVGGAIPISIEIYEGSTLKFVAKLAKPAFQSGTRNLVVDDCMILPSPWTGMTNEGSCQWNISELAN